MFVLSVSPATHSLNAEIKTNAWKTHAVPMPFVSTLPEATIANANVDSLEIRLPCVRPFKLTSDVKIPMIAHAVILLHAHRDIDVKTVDA